MKGKEIVNYSLESMLKAGADKAQCLLEDSEKNELNVDAGEFSLLRTIFDSNLTMTALKNDQKGTVSINKTTGEAIDEAVQQVIKLAESSPPDAAHDISPKQPVKEFSGGNDAPDLDMMYDRFQEFVEYVKLTSPLTILEQSIFDFTRRQNYLGNTNQVDFTISKGIYNFWAMFTSKEGKNSSSFNYSGFYANQIEQPLYRYGSLDMLLKQSSEQIHTKPLPKKFTGEIIVAPDCVDTFVRYATMYLRDHYLITGNSIFKDKLNESIADKKLTLHSKPVSEEIEAGYFVTEDGYETQNSTIIEKGVLRTFLLSLYGANKTGRDRAVNSGFAYVMDAGDVAYDEMVKSVKKGILLQRFSGGTPSDNGDFSGVAKNSYYIEDGKIQYPLIETMVSGNIGSLLHFIKDISQERINFGSDIYPWIKFDGVTIS